jgi:hypothetical protein
MRDGRVNMMLWKRDREPLSLAEGRDIPSSLSSARARDGSSALCVAHRAGMTRRPKETPVDRCGHLPRKINRVHQFNGMAIQGALIWPILLS